MKTEARYQIYKRRILKAYMYQEKHEHWFRVKPFRVRQLIKANIKWHLWARHYNEYWYNRGFRGNTL